MDYSPVKVKVWGDFACFTRPEMKVERVSYPVMTPSAGRGILEAIFWKPEFTWCVTKIEVLNDIRYYSIVRNEVSSKMSERSARSWEQSGGGYFAEDDRAQRHTLALRDVAYIIHADVEVKDGVPEDPAKFRDQFRRRVQRGQYFHHPYLGTREFAAKVAEPDGSERPINYTDDLGKMLLDLEYESDGTDRGKPIFFHARLDKGTLYVPKMEEVQ